MALVLIIAVSSSGATAGQGVVSGITVHGRWVIDVRNPDGSLSSRTEFDNALSSGGVFFLVRWLTRQGSPGPWIIELGGAGEPPPCAGTTYGYAPAPPNAQGSCYIHETVVQPRPGSAEFRTLTVSRTDTRIILTGSIPSLPATGRIGFVATRTTNCEPDQAPQTCTGHGAHGDFTSHLLRDGQGVFRPIDVQAGQVVQVTVTLSFS